MDNKLKIAIASSIISMTALTGCSQTHKASETKSDTPQTYAERAVAEDIHLDTYQQVTTRDVSNVIDGAEKVNISNDSSIQISAAKLFTNSSNGTISLNPVNVSLEETVIRNMDPSGDTLESRLVLPKNTSLLPYSTKINDTYTEPTQVVAKSPKDSVTPPKIYLVTKHRTIDLQKDNPLGGDKAIVIPNDDVKSAKFKIVSNNKTTYVNLLGKITN